jgi:organic radical activating enzyme
MPLVRALAATGKSVDLETNGTVAPPGDLPPYVENFVISPKLSNSGNDSHDVVLVPDLPAGPLKFVVDSVADLEEVEQFSRELPHHEIIIMPMGTDPRGMIRKMQVLRAPVKSYGWRLQPRLHVLMGLR